MWGRCRIYYICKKKQQKNIDNSQRQKCCAICFAHWNSLKLGKILDRGHFLWQKWGMQTLYNPITPVRKCTLCNVVLGTNPFLILCSLLLHLTVIFAFLSLYTWHSLHLPSFSIHWDGANRPTSACSVPHWSNSHSIGFFYPLVFTELDGIQTPFTLFSFTWANVVLFYFKCNEIIWGPSFWARDLL